MRKFRGSIDSLWSSWSNQEGSGGRDRSRVRHLQGYAKGSGQPYNKAEAIGQTPVEVGGEYIHGCKPVRGAKFEGGGSGQVLCCESLGLQALIRRISISQRGAAGGI